MSGWFPFPTSRPLRRRYSNSPSEHNHWWRHDDAKYIGAIKNDRRFRRLVNSARRSTGDELEKLYDGWLPGSAGGVIVCRGRLCNDMFNKK